MRKSERFILRQTARQRPSDTEHARGRPKQKWSDRVREDLRSQGVVDGGKVAEIIRMQHMFSWLWYTQSNLNERSLKSLRLERFDSKLYFTNIEFQKFKNKMYIFFLNDSLTIFEIE